MSYTIFYDKRIFKLDEDQYITMLSFGDNNVWDISPRGREIPSKEWGTLRHKGKFILSKEEINLALDIYGKEWCIAKSRYRYFDRDTNEFKSWVLKGLSRAITVEEAVSYHNKNTFRIYLEEDPYDYTYAETTEELISAINLYRSKNKPFELSLNCRDFTPKRRITKANYKYSLNY